MFDDQELDQSIVGKEENSGEQESNLANLRAKLPQLHDFKDPQEQIEVDTIAKIKAKMTDILGDYLDSEDKTIVIDLVSQTVATGCIAYDIDPVELIVIPRPTQQGEHHVAMADRKKVGPLDIKQLFIDPSEVMFRVQILSQHGETTAKNVTDLMFAFMHEMAHLGQAIHAEDELNRSKQFPYADRPTEIQADEVALTYCRNLNTFLDGKPNRTRADNILQIGLLQTITDAEANRRPQM